MSILKKAAGDLLERIASVPICALLAVVLWEVARIAAADTYLITEGPSASAFSVMLCCFYFALMQGTLHRYWYEWQPRQRFKYCCQFFISHLLILAFVFVFRLLFANVIPPFDPLFGCIAGAIVGWMFLNRWHFFTWQQGQNNDPHVRGTRLVEGTLTPEGNGQSPTNNPIAPLEKHSPQSPVRWANNVIAATATEAQFCAVGKPGSGKSLMHREIMRSVLPMIEPNSGLGAIVFDVKQDVISQLNAMQLNCPLVILNPLDNRAVPWAIGKDLADPGNSLQYATIFISSDNARRADGDDGFFLKAARMGLAGAIDALALCAPERWTLRDLICLTTDPGNLRALLTASPHTAPILKTFDDQAAARNQRSLFRDIVATIAASMLPLKPIAGVWEHISKTTKPISFKEWAKEGGSILVIGNRFTHKDSLMPINRVMFHQLANQLLSRPECPGRWRTWFFIDELEEGGRLDGLSQFVTDGRSKGIRNVFGFQDIQGLRNVYGEQMADKLVGLCGFTSILHLSNPETAEWASKRIGEREVREITRSANDSETTGNQSSRSTSSGTNEQIQSRRAVLASQIMHMHLASSGRVEGYHILASERIVAHAFTQHVLVPNVEKDDFDERTRREDFLPTPWSNADWERLRISPPPPDGDTEPPSSPTNPSPLDDLPLF